MLGGLVEGSIDLIVLGFFLLQGSFQFVLAFLEFVDLSIVFEVRFFNFGVDVGQFPLLFHQLYLVLSYESVYELNGFLCLVVIFFI